MLVRVRRAEDRNHPLGRWYSGSGQIRSPGCSTLSTAARNKLREQRFLTLFRPDTGSLEIAVDPSLRRRNPCPLDAEEAPKIQRDAPLRFAVSSPLAGGREVF